MPKNIGYGASLWPLENAKFLPPKIRLRAPAARAIYHGIVISVFETLPFGNASRYRWVSYKKTIRSAGYFVIETLCYRKSFRRNKFDFQRLSLLCWGQQFLTWIFTFLVSTFWRPELLVWRRFVAGTLWRCNILHPKNKNLPSLYETRGIFSYELCYRNLCYRRQTCSFHFMSCFYCPNECQHVEKSSISKFESERIFMRLWKGHKSCLRGHWRNLGQNVVYFYLRKVIFSVWLITCQKVMGLRARESPKIWDMIEV